jgi:FkbM family methyltransferase
MRKDLIIDVGMNDGRDTAFYLHRGFRVVAIDANPHYIEDARRMFAREIGEGRLTLLNIAVAPERGRATLYYSDANPGVASLNAAHVRMHGSITASFEVDCVPFAEVLREHGVPHYLKVDIETLDRVCLVALEAGDLPDYISWEEGGEALENLEHLHGLGYRGFKAINQVTFREQSREHSLMNRARYRVNGLLGRPERPFRTRDGWEFRAGCAGPFGPESDGRWRSYEEITAQWREFCRRYPRIEHGGGWYDFHARAAARD